jgi:hypothetical protein
MQQPRRLIYGKYTQLSQRYTKYCLQAGAGLQNWCSAIGKAALAVVEESLPAHSPSEEIASFIADKLADHNFIYREPDTKVRFETFIGSN